MKSILNDFSFSLDFLRVLMYNVRVGSEHSTFLEEIKMIILGKIIDILKFSASTPEMFGWVHILSLILAIVLGIVLSIVFKGANEKTVRRILLITSLISIALEIYKQFVFSFSFDGQVVTFDYQWYAFPLQFCSTPMYVGLLAAFIKKKWLHETLCAYLATYGLFAGLAVMFYPATVFIELVGINIQTMVCHGLMVSIGIFLLASGYVKPKHKTMLSALCLFASIVGVVMILNEVVYYSGILNGETLNLFFISRHFEPSLAVYSIFQKLIPYPFCVFFYIFGFSGASYILLLIDMCIHKLVYVINKKHRSVTQ